MAFKLSHHGATGCCFEFRDGTLGLLFLVAFPRSGRLVGRSYVFQYWVPTCFPVSSTRPFAAIRSGNFVFNYPCALNLVAGVGPNHQRD